MPSIGDKNQCSENLRDPVRSCESLSSPQYHDLVNCFHAEKLLVLVFSIVCIAESSDKI